MKSFSFFSSETGEQNRSLDKDKTKYNTDKAFLRKRNSKEMQKKNIVDELNMVIPYSSLPGAYLLYASPPPGPFLHTRSED